MSKGSGGGGGSQVTRVEPSTVAEPFLRGLYTDARNLYNTGGPQVFTGQTFAQPSATTLTGENLALANALGPQSQLINQLGAAQQFALAGPANLASNPFLSDAADAATRPLFTQAQGLLQQARRDANRAGQLGGDRQAILEQGVIGDYLQKAGDIRSRMFSDAYSDALSNQAKAIGLAPQSIAQFAGPAQSLMTLGARQEARDQMAIDDARRIFEAQQARPFENLARYQSIVSGGDLGRTMSQTMAGGSPSFGQRAIGGVASGLGASQLAAAEIGGKAIFGPQIANLAGPIGIAVGLGSALGFFD